MTSTVTFSARNFEAAILKWSEANKPDGLILIPPGLRADTFQHDAFAQWQLEFMRAPRRRTGIPDGRGLLRIDAYWTRYQDASPTTLPLTRGVQLVDWLLETFELQSPLVFDVKAWEEGSGVLTTLASSLTSGATSVSLTSAAGFPSPSGECVIGQERIAYAGVSGSTLTGATRGVGHTMPAAHASGAEVASELGPEIAVLYLGEGDVSPLGFDVVAQRMRILVKIPFEIAYANA